ncbi:hypothetical protein L1887_44301 [Cichorium endivia]|nr:hypothetical protein L1887_44301 [Cichorium endivia]
MFETSSATFQLKVQTEASTKLVGGVDVEKKGEDVDVHRHVNHGHVQGFMLPLINDFKVYRYRLFPR